MMKRLLYNLFLLCCILAFQGCQRGDTNKEKVLNTKKEDPIVDPCQSLTWPPNTAQYDSLVATLPSYPNEVFGGIFQEEPLEGKGDQSLGSDGSFWPTKGAFHFISGTYFTSIDDFETRAYFRDWDYIYTDSARTKVEGWGPCLTHGEVIFFKSMLEKKRDYYCHNFFEMTDLGDSLLLVKLDSTKGHQLCFLPTGGGGYYSIASAPGSKMEVEGGTLNRKLGGWYCEDQKMNVLK